MVLNYALEISWGYILNFVQNVIYQKAAKCFKCQG